ncbi:MAG: MBL fold metallo-hydrolase [Chloroflexi bacterium]|nr:MBL fold metallo-hydrolase [Chloroflexota bacterium]
MKQIAANVYCEDRYSLPPRYLGCNVSFVITGDGVVLIDTPYMPTEAVRWRDEIAKIGEVRYIINTDHHTDHNAGNSFIKGVVVSHESVRDLFMSPLDIPSNVALTGGQIRPGQRTVGDLRRKVAEMDPEGLSLMADYEPRPPTLTFSERMALHVGGFTFQLMHLPGHTKSHIGVYLQEAKVFFSGDNFTNLTQPSMAESWPLDWVESLKRIESMDIDVVVPGHGEVCTDKGQIREFRLFIEECVQIVRQAIRKGMSKEETVSTLSFEGLYPRIPGGRAVHPGAETQRKNVARLYEMLVSMKFNRDQVTLSRPTGPEYQETPKATP